MNYDYVSIIICHYGKADDSGETYAVDCRETRGEMLRKCITSLQENTDYPAEVIVIDNGGNVEDSKWLLQKAEEGVINTYLKNKNNMHFGWAWNQGIALATSNLILLTCNDILFKPQWLSKTVEAFNAYPNEKYIASPYVTPDKRKGKNPRGMKGKFRLNSMAGSNCMLMKKETYFEIEPMTTHHIAGSHWHRRMNKKGYLVILPEEDMIEEMAFRKGLNVKNKIEVKKQLLNNLGEVNLTFQYYK